MTLADLARLTRWPDGRPRVPILLYHMIVRPGEQTDAAMAVSQTRFDEQLACLTEAGYTCISLVRVIAYIRDGERVPDRSFVITFDDGFLDTYRLAWPVLRRRGMTATVFLVGDLIGGLSEWMRVEPSGPQLLMGADQIREMNASGIDFGSHGRRHARLTDLDDAALDEELLSSRHRLSELLGHEVREFGYPYGRFDDRVRAATARAGYTAAVSVMAGHNNPRTDPLALRRVLVSGRDTGAGLLAKMVLGQHTLRLGALAGPVRRAARKLSRGSRSP